MTITTQSAIFSGVTQTLDFFKPTIDGGSNAQGRYVSHWRSVGTPGAGAIPTTAVVPTKSDVGCINFVTPSSGDTFLAKVSCNSQQRVNILIMDRLIHSGGLVGNILTSQTVNTPALPGRGERSDGGDVEWFEELYATSANGINITATYTDGITNTPGQTVTYSRITTGKIGLLSRIYPAAGQTIKSIESIQLASSAGSAGNFGITACRRICTIPNFQVSSSLEYLKLGLRKIYPTSCLFLVLVPAATLDSGNTGTLHGSLTLTQG